MFKTEDFTKTERIGSAEIQSVLDNVEYFHERYGAALDYIGKYHATLRFTDEDLFYDILEEICAMKGVEEHMDEWDEVFDDVEEVFG